MTEQMVLDIEGLLSTIRDAEKELALTDLSDVGSMQRGVQAAQRWLRDALEAVSSHSAGDG